MLKSGVGRAVENFFWGVAAFFSGIMLLFPNFSLTLQRKVIELEPMSRKWRGGMTGLRNDVAAE